MTFSFTKYNYWSIYERFLSYLNSYWKDSGQLLVAINYQSDTIVPFSYETSTSSFRATYRQ